MADQPGHRRRADRGLPRELVVRRHRDDPEFGYRFLVDEARQAGEVMAERTAWRICSELGWWPALGKKCGRNGKKPGQPVHDDCCAVVDVKNRVRHEFTSTGPNELWLADLTERWTAEGKLYDCDEGRYSNRIVGCSIDSRMKSRLALAALNHAVVRRGEVVACVPSGRDERENRWARDHRRFDHG